MSVIKFKRGYLSRDPNDLDKYFLSRDISDAEVMTGTLVQIKGYVADIMEKNKIYGKWVFERSSNFVIRDASGKFLRASYFSVYHLHYYLCEASSFVSEKKAQAYLDELKKSGVFIAGLRIVSIDDCPDLSPPV